ncbi:MAG: hypothetical protein IPF90_02190 [Actinomycetales bacterium]|nr:hypothetical protein [Candidatus Phosphoribacter baldrii]
MLYPLVPTPTIVLVALPDLFGDPVSGLVHQISVATTACQIDSLLASGLAVPFGTLRDAESQGFLAHFCVPA